MDSLLAGRNFLKKKTKWIQRSYEKQKKNEKSLAFYKRISEILEKRDTVSGRTMNSLIAKRPDEKKRKRKVEILLWYPGIS